MSEARRATTSTARDGGDAYPGSAGSCRRLEPLGETEGRDNTPRGSSQSRLPVAPAPDVSHPSPPSSNMPKSMVLTPPFAICCRAQNLKLRYRQRLLLNSEPAQVNHDNQRFHQHHQRHQPQSQQ
uniref:Uncharacterized protein n=1 Tax=Caenorhabditis japonica TaxID=281687 RepID=A0A8R1ENT6_CAEJA